MTRFKRCQILEKLNRTRRVIRGLPLELAMTPGELVMYSILRGGELGLNCSLRRALKALLQKGRAVRQEKMGADPAESIPQSSLD